MKFSARYGGAALRITAVTALAGVAATAAASGADAAARQVSRGYGTVRAVADGDTPYVGGKRLSDRVRLIGVQAAETSHGGRGKTWCHGGEAKKRLGALLIGKRVQLRSQSPGRDGQGNRPLRALYLPRKGGGYMDVQQVMLQEGHVLWHPDKREWQNNRLYHVLADRAAAARARGTIWDDDWCGAGPSQGAGLSLYVHWDAQGQDEDNLNDEYVVVTNEGTAGVPLAGWRLRDGSLNTFTFPSGAYVPPGGTATLRIGSGETTRTATGTTYHWGQRHPMLANADPANGMGDGMYLLDPQGDFRAWRTWPCVVSCTTSR
ncbi:lamin tail domain-containing protein [Spirillospora albida]|uniref:lamin tail domain-containing protein n=1 Tax=Spirillospora albida TaxID=58123 RepID=UPI00068CF681|nr:lamin tail domain-containing protein [Spirillospora albida]